MEAREIIARKLCELEGWIWNCIPQEINRLFCITSKSRYLRNADEIIALIAGANNQTKKEGDEHGTDGTE